MAKWEEYAETEEGYEEALRRISAWPGSGLSLSGLGLKKIPEELKGVADLTSLNLSRNQIVDLRPLTGLNKLTALFLGTNQIVHIKVLASMTNLTRLGLRENQIVDLQPLRELTNLTWLDLYRNQLVDLQPLRGLTNLTELDLGENHIVDLQPLIRMPQLTELNLDWNEIVDLQPLTGLQKLTTLSLNDNQVADLHPLESLTNLIWLSLDINKFVDLQPLARLTKLTELSLSQNKIVDLQPLARLTKLTWLYLNANKIVDLQPLARLTELTTLGLRENKIIDIQPLGDLTSLSWLDLNGNQIVDTQPLARLTKLTWLALSNNRSLSSLRPLQKHMAQRGIKAYTDLTMNAGIYVAGCPLVDPPLEIVEEGTQAILEYWLKEATGTITNYTGRILLLGDGEAGKTTLRRKLEDAASPIPIPEEDAYESTLGFEVLRNYKVPAPDTAGKDNYLAHVWDFGGQPEQQPTHQYFFGPNSLYVVLIEARSDGRLSTLKYWLRLIDLHGRRHGEDKTPVVIIFNERGGDHFIEPPLDVFRKSFTRLHLYPVSVNLGRPFREQDRNDPRYAEEVLPLLHREFARLPKVGAEVPAPSVDLIARVTKERAAGRRYVPRTEFIGWCTEYGVEDPGVAESLLWYLKALGEVIYFAPQESTVDYYLHLRNYVFIDPEWVTEAVYFLLRRQDIKKANGLFHERVLQEQWIDYTEDERNILEKLLMEDALEVCLRAPNQNGYLIAASLLPVDNIGLELPLQADGGIRMRLNYTQIVPPSIVTRLIVRLNEYLEPGKFYRSGALLHDRHGKGAYARLEQDINNEHYVNVEIDRGGRAGRALLDVIRREVRSIHSKSYPEVDFQETVPCCCAACKRNDKPHYFPLNYLERKEDINPAARVDCIKSLNEVAVSELLNQVSSLEDRRQGRIQLDLSAEEYAELRQAAASRTVIHTTNANVNSGSGKQEIQAAPAAAAEPFLTRRNKRALLATAILSVLTAIATWLYFPESWAGYAWLPFLVVIGLGALWALTRENKYFSGGMAVFWASSGIVGILQSLPTVDGYLKVTGEDARGFVRFAIESSTGLTMATLVMGGILAGWLFWLAWREDKASTNPK